MTDDPFHSALAATLRGEAEEVVGLAPIRVPAYLGEPHSEVPEVDDDGDDWGSQ